MANPNKAQDPAAAALSAIEEALNLTDLMPSETASEHDDDGKGQASRTPEVGAPDRHPLLAPEVTSGRRDDTRIPRLPPADASKLFGDTLRDVEQANEPRLDMSANQPLPQGDRNGRERIEPPAADERIARSRPTAAAANDDKESVGAILRTMQIKPSRTPMVIAGLAAVAWIAKQLTINQIHPTG